MNCIQAQAMLAAFRELKKGEPDTLELDVHLEECASCRQLLASYNFVGEQVRSLPNIQPSPEMHANLMRALAKEQLRYIQRTASSADPRAVSTPEFLKPYLSEHAQTTPHAPDSIAAFSSAETGPLPIISAKRKRRPYSHMNQLAVLGLAATFLMVLMMGGITSLLLLAHGKPQTAITTASGNSLNRFSELADVKARYTTSTSYQHVVSAVADDQYIYYTAYGDDNNGGWMLEQLDRTTLKSTPLLARASTTPLIVLANSNDWVVWLQFDDLKSTVRANLPHDTAAYASLHSWSLRYLSLTSQHAITTANFSTPLPLTLLKGVFNRATAPGWISTPVQGTWFIQDTLLVAFTDDNGISHLLRYDLDAGNASFSVQELAKAPAGHILTSPTANSDGTDIYWAEEWLSEDGNLHSNIWEQQVLDMQIQSRGRILENTMATKQVFRADGMSFRPQVVDDALFLLSTSGGINSTQYTSAPPLSLNAGAVPKIDASIFATPLDDFVQGTVLMIPLDGDAAGIPTELGTLGQSSTLQAGTDFALWQDNNGYKMYDVQTQSEVTVGDTLDSANFVAVNGDTAVWTVVNGTETTNTNIANPSAILLAFNWPK